MEKAEIEYWRHKHDVENAFWINKEREIGDRLRASKELTKVDLIEIIEWKFEGLEGRKKRELDLIARLDEHNLEQVSNLVFNLSIGQDLYRIKRLCGLDHGIGPAVSSVILTFFDPKNYGILDFHVWQEVFREDRKSFTAENYVRLLSRLRDEANRHGLEVRAVEKAYFKRNFDRDRKMKSHVSRISLSNKQASETGESRLETADTCLLRQKFFEQLLEKSKEKITLFSNVSLGGKQNWVSAGAGLSGALYQYVILMNGARVQLSMESKDRDGNKRIYDALHRNAGQIEEDFGESLEWKRLDTCISSRILRTVTNQGLTDTHTWSATQEKMINAMANLEKALSRHIEKLRSQNS